MVADASKDRDASDNCNANEWEFLERWARQLEKIECSGTTEYGNLHVDRPAPKRQGIPRS